MGDGQKREAQLVRIAGAQLGVIGTRQLVRVGLARSSIALRVKQRRLLPVLPGVYALPGSVRSWLRDLSAAVVWAGEGVVVSGFAAAKLWELDGLGRACMELSVVSSRSPRREGITVHRVAHLDPADVSARRWPPRTTIGRTLVDLAPRVSLRDLERGLDCAWRRYSPALHWVWEAYHRVPVDARRGLTGLLHLLQTRLNEPGDSDLEALTQPLIRAAGLPPPVMHYRLVLPDLSAELDFAWPELKVALQTHGATFHTRHGRWNRDLLVKRRAEDAGWFIIEASREDILLRPDEVMSSLGQRLERARRAS